MADNLQPITPDQIMSNPILSTMFAPFFQSGASLQSTELGNTGQALSNTQNVVNTQQIQAPQQLSADLKNGMTLKDALAKYSALKMDPHDIYKQYLSENTFGPNKTPKSPIESPEELINMGVPADALGQIGQTGTVQDRWNTGNAIEEIRLAKDLFDKTQAANIAGNKLGVNANSKAYQAAMTVLGNHLSSLIPGTPGGESTAASLLGLLPNSTNLTSYAPNVANASFDTLEKMLLAQKGYSYQDAYQKPPAKDSFTNPQNSTQQKLTGSNLLNNILQTALPTAGGIGGGVLGGIAGAAVPVADLSGVPEAAGVVGGSGAGSGAGQYLADILTGHKPGSDVGQQAALGAIFSGAGVAGGKLAGGVLGKLGLNEAINGLNLTRLGQNTLSKLNGEPVAKTLIDNNLAGKGAEGVKEGIQKVQSQFDSIAKNTNIPINQDSLLKNMTTALSELQNSSVESVKSLAKPVEENINNIINKISEGKITSLNDLNTERKAFDSATKASQFGDANWGVNRIVGDILRKSVQDTADLSNAVGPKGESLKDIGNNLRKLYNISDMADKRVGQGNSNSILSISNLIMAGIGGAVGNSMLGPLGFLAAGVPYAARSALANPAVAGLLSKAAINSGKTLGKPIVGGAIGNTGNGLLQYLGLSPQ